MNANDNNKSGKSGERKIKRQPRHLARIGAVQALYQMDLAGAEVSDVLEQFITGRFQANDSDINAELAENNLSGGDAAFFSEIVEGVVRRQREIDPLIDSQLAEGWRLVRVDSILRAILRAGAYELFDRSDVPARVVMNEYINVGHAFFSQDEPRVINGVLNALAQQLRPNELKPEDTSSSG